MHQSGSQKGFHRVERDAQAVGNFLVFQVKEINARNDFAGLVGHGGNFFLDFVNQVFIQYTGFCLLNVFPDIVQAVADNVFFLQAIQACVASSSSGKNWSA